MPLITWNSSLSVNVAEIDQQHQKLIGMINGLDEAMRQGQGKVATGKILEEMVSYITTHFEAEERYFRRFNYPDTAKHIQEHTAFVQKAVDFRRQFNAGKLGLSIEIMDFLSTWLCNHIKGTDQKYTACFHANGLK